MKFKNYCINCLHPSANIAGTHLCHQVSILQLETWNNFSAPCVIAILLPILGFSLLLFVSFHKKNSQTVLCQMFHLNVRHHQNLLYLSLLSQIFRLRHLEFCLKMWIILVGNFLVKTYTVGPCGSKVPRENMVNDAFQKYLQLRKTSITILKKSLFRTCV